MYSWSIACQRCSNYIFVINSTPGFNIMGKGDCKTRPETFMFGDWVQLILENWRYLNFHTLLHQKLLFVFSISSDASKDENLGYDEDTWYSPSHSMKLLVKYTTIFIEGHAFENIICKMVPILILPQCVKPECGQCWYFYHKRPPDFCQMRQTYPTLLIQSNTGIHFTNNFFIEAQMCSILLSSILISNDPYKILCMTQPQIYLFGHSTILKWLTNI